VARGEPSAGVRACPRNERAEAERARGAATQGNEPAPAAGSHAAQPAERDGPRPREREGQEERRLAIKIASTAPPSSPSRLRFSTSLPTHTHTHTRLPVVLSTCPQLHLTFSHIPTPVFGEGRAALAPAPRTSPAPPLRPGTSCLLARPCSCSHLPLAKKFRLLLCFAPPARLFCRCCRDRECACAFGFTALGRFPGPVFLGDDSLTGSARVGALSLNPSSCFSFVSLLGKTMSR
jgi:hypothetical protein